MKEKSKKIEGSDDSEEVPEPDAVLSAVQKINLKVFGRRVVMFSKFKRSRLRKKLKKDKLRLLSEVLTINKQLKILEALDIKEKENKI